MSKQEKYTYPGEKPQVHWDGNLCIHYGECGQAAGDLFVGGRNPWCQPDLSDDDEISDIVLRCPTGALTATFEDGKGVVPGAENNTAIVSQNGPIYLKGRLDIEGVGDEASGTRFRAALCRCGESANKPFCDNSHESAGFKDSGAVGQDGPGLEAEGGSLLVKPVPDGPVMVVGNLSISSSTGRAAWKGEKAFLCRCGASKNKPFCDGSHKGIGFKSD